MTNPLSAPTGDDGKQNGPTGGSGGGQQPAASNGTPLGSHGAGGADGKTAGQPQPSPVRQTVTEYAASGDPSNLAHLVRQLEAIEIRTDTDLYRYARLLRAIGLEFALRIQMDADWIAALLSQYKGQWYTFGAQSRIRARLVAGHLRAGGKAAEILGIAGVKTYAAFQRHFVKPEIEAQEAGKKRKGGFTITEAEKKNQGGKAA